MCVGVLPKKVQQFGKCSQPEEKERTNIISMGIEKQDELKNGTILEINKDEQENAILDNSPTMEKHRINTTTSTEEEMLFAAGKVEHQFTMKVSN
jgi:hypothetical protein